MWRTSACPATKDVAAGRLARVLGPEAAGEAPARTVRPGGCVVEDAEVHAVEHGVGRRREARLGSRGHHEPGREPAVVDAREELLDPVPAVGHLAQQGAGTVVVPVEEHPRLVVHLHPRRGS